MDCRIATLCCFALVAIAVRPGLAETLKVGPSEEYTKPSQAIAAAKPGDVVEIASGDYLNDWSVVRAPNLIIRGVGPTRPRLVSNGLIPNRKGIFVVSGAGLTVENIEFDGARVRHENGAGIRAQGQGLTVRNCRFHDCEDGILGGVGEILIEHCEFNRCGHCLGPHATHSCYIGGGCTKLTFRFNYSARTHEGHLLKARARESWVLYNRLTDEEGGGSAVADFPNGSIVVLVGNVMHKGPQGLNNRLIAYGMEGVKHQRNELFVVNNTMHWENRRDAWFVRVENAPEGFAAVIRNNLCVGPIPLTNCPQAEATGNLLVKSACPV